MKKKIILITGIIILAILLLGGYKFLTKKETIKNEEQSININDKLVTNSLKKFESIESLNDKVKALANKMFYEDKIVTSATFTNEEKLFLSLLAYSNQEKKPLYYIEEPLEIPIDTLKNTFFYEDNFLDNFKDPNKKYTILNTLNYEYQDNKVKVIGDNKLNDMDNRLFAYNILNAKKTIDTLEITFRLAYLDYQYSNTNTKVLMYNSLNATNEIKTITLNQTIENGTTKDEIFDVKNIDEQFNTYKYTLKLANGNTYFVSLEQI